MFPQKFYCGTYPLVLDLTPHPHIRYLRGQWKMNRWGPRDTTPLFGFYLTAEESVMPERWARLTANAVLMEECGYSRLIRLAA